jgi:hypothetical protein
MPRSCAKLVAMADFPDDLPKHPQPSMAQMETMAERLEQRLRALQGKAAAGDDSPELIAQIKSVLAEIDSCLEAMDLMGAHNQLRIV